MTAIALLYVACNRTATPDGTWELTTTTLESSCPDRRPLKRTSKDTYIVSTSGEAIRLAEDKFDYSGVLHGDHATLSGPTQSAAGFLTRISITFDGSSELEGEATLSNHDCIIKEAVAGRRTSTDVPAINRASAGVRPPARPLPELPKNFRTDVSPSDFTGFWQVLETVDGSPCKDGQYSRGATLKVALAPDKKVVVNSREPTSGWGNAIYGPVTASVVANALEWNGTFPSGNDTITVAYSLRLTEEGSIAGTGRWTYSYKDQPARQCSGPSVVLGMRSP